jgi:glycosyl transferase family 87
MAGKCVVSPFLLLALVSNAVATRFNIPRGLSHGVLVCLLVADFWFPYSHLNGGSAGMKIILGGWVALPVFFSGAIFSSSLKRVGHTAEVLGINLFGAAEGGILENSVMLGGTSIVGILAILLYHRSYSAADRIQICHVANCCQLAYDSVFTVMLSKPTQRKLTLYFCAMVVLHSHVLWQSRQFIPEGLPDFSGSYTAGLLLRDGHGSRLYDDHLQESVQRSFSPLAVQKRRTILPYLHLPYEALLYAPLAHFSYLTAYAIWLAVNLALLCAIPFLLRSRLERLGTAPVYLWLLACFAFFPIFIALIQGQDSILLLFLYCLAWRSLERGSEFASGSWLALGLYKYHLVVPFVLPLWRRRKLIGGFLSVAAILGLVSLAITGWSSLRGYPRYLWGTEHDLRYGFNTLPGLIANLRGLISGLVPAAHPEIETGLLVLLSAMVLWMMMYAADKTSSADSEGRRALFALGLVGAVQLSYHLYVHDLSLLFLAIVLVLEILLSDPPIPNWTRTMLYACIALMSCSPLYLILTLRYGELRLMTIVLLAFFVGLLSLINSHRVGGTISPPASAGR